MYSMPAIIVQGAGLIAAQRHQAEEPLKLYAGWFCPFVQRAWLALEEKGIPYQYVEGEFIMPYLPFCN